MINYHNLEQGSPEWTQAKIGKVSQAEMKNIIDVRNGSLKSPDVVLTQISKILAEQLTGFSMDSDFMNEAMEWGVMNESAALEPLSSQVTFHTGGVTNSEFKYMWLSPDMLGVDGTGNEIGFEAKCPNSNTHIKYAIKGGLPSDHKVQVMTYFVMIPELRKMTFISYDPRVKGLERFEVVIYRNDHLPFIENYRKSILEFENKIDEVKSKLIKE